MAKLITCCAVELVLTVAGKVPHLMRVLPQTIFSKAIFTAIAALPEFDPELFALASEEFAKLPSDRERQVRSLENLIAGLDRKLQNLATAVANLGISATLTDGLRKFEAERHERLAELRAAQATPTLPPSLPPMEVLRAQALEEFNDLIVGSADFARLMSRILSRIEVFPVRLCDGKKVTLRARLRLYLAGFVDPSYATPTVLGQLSRDLVVDLFDPPQRAAYREEIMEKRRTGLTERLIAKQLGLPHHYGSAACSEIAATDGGARIGRPVCGNSRSAYWLHKATAAFASAIQICALPTRNAA